MQYLCSKLVKPHKGFTVAYLEVSNLTVEGGARVTGISDSFHIKAALIDCYFLP